MLKKILFVLMILFVLSACQKSDEQEFVVPEGYRGPTSPPNPEALQPSYGPNETVPADSL